MWSETQGFPSLEQPVVSQQPTQPLVDLVVEPSQYLVHPFAPKGCIIPSEIDPYVIEPMSSLVNPTLPLELNQFHYRSIPLFLWRVKCLLVTFSSLLV